MHGLLLLFVGRSGLLLLFVERKEALVAGAAADWAQHWCELRARKGARHHTKALHTTRLHMTRLHTTRLHTPSQGGLAREE